MRVYLALFFTCLFFLPLLAQDDPNEKPPFIRAALIGGMNVAQVDGDGISGFRKWGANGGAGAFVNLSKGFHASFEILYSMRGAKRGKNQTATLEGLSLDYIEVPFMINYNDKDKAIFGLGFSWNTLVRSKVTPEILADDVVFKRSSFDIVGGVTFLIKKRYGINFRYSYSLSSIGTGTQAAPGSSGLRLTLDGKLKNNVVGLRFIYFLN